MRLSLTDRERTLREEVRAFLDDHPVDPDDVPADFDARVTFLRGWQRQLSEAGLVGITWPAAYGGRGATQIEKIIVGQEMSRAGAPELIGSVGLEVIGPSLIEHGTDAQKARYVAPILSAAELWCQGFSEPGAGSDLAALRTRAEDRGDHFLLRGQKIWTTNAQHARWCAVLAVTDAEVPAHKGISYLIVDLESPGIEVRALALSTGDAEFGEVFFDDVRVPKENLLGPLNGGWRIAMHTLAHERGPYAMGRQVLLSVQLDRLVELAREIPRDGGTAWEVPEIRASLARARIALEVLKHQCYSSVGRSLATGHPGFETSIDKILLGTAEQRLAQTALDVLGPYATTSDGLPWGDNLIWHHAYLYGRAGSVYGGTAQVQKNIIAERILGLPRSG
jgi:alkylation response protein AidB-like acyl-CoA dehydrogenase